MGAIASIIIPAHNEANVISRCLSSIYQTTEPGEFEVVVVCNGCSDNTADIVRNSFPLVGLIDIPTASKTRALNVGDSGAKFFPRIYLDADLSVTGDSLRALVDALDSQNALAACGKMEIDATHSSLLVRQFYKAWEQNSYLEKGKFGGLFAVSLQGHERISPFPNVTNDDELVRRLFAAHERAYTPNCSFKMTAPRDIKGLTQIRTRAIRGTIELEHRGLQNDEGSSIVRFLRQFKRILLKPSLWSAVPVYVLFSFYIRLKLNLSPTRGSVIWERDESSRELV